MAAHTSGVPTAEAGVVDATDLVRSSHELHLAVQELRKRVDDAVTAARRLSSEYEVARIARDLLDWTSDVPLDSSLAELRVAANAREARRAEMMSAARALSRACQQEAAAQARVQRAREALASVIAARSLERG